MFDHPKVVQARHFATLAHQGQFRKYTNEPYITHPTRVAELVFLKAQDSNAPLHTLLAAAFLHDVLEDTPYTLKTLVREFGEPIANLVFELTDQFSSEEYPHQNRAWRKQREAERLALVSEDAKLIKLCDLIDNTNSIVEHDPKFAITYLREKAYVLECMGFGK